jgi:hypothetical protein
MARGTAHLARIAEKQHEATITPIVRVGKIGAPDRADIVTVNEGTDSEALMVVLENSGPMAAEVETVTLTPGGQGQQFDDLATPEIAPGGSRSFDFLSTPDYKAAWRSGGPVSLRIQYRALATGTQYRAGEQLEYREGKRGEEWRIIGSQAPRLIPPPARSFI